MSPSGLHCSFMFQDEREPGGDELGKMLRKQDVAPRRYREECGGGQAREDTVKIRVSLP